MFERKLPDTHTPAHTHTRAHLTDHPRIPARHLFSPLNGSLSLLMDVNDGLTITFL